MLSRSVVTSLYHVDRCSYTVGMCEPVRMALGQRVRRRRNVNLLLHERASMLRAGPKGCSDPCTTFVPIHVVKRSIVAGDGASRLCGCCRRGTLVVCKQHLSPADLIISATWDEEQEGRSIHLISSSELSRCQPARELTTLVHEFSMGPAAGPFTCHLSDSSAT